MKYGKLIMFLLAINKKWEGLVKSTLQKEILKYSLLLECLFSEYFNETQIST